MEMTLYHVSQDCLTEFSAYPAWFMMDKEFGQYLFNKDKKQNLLYEVFADCNILTNDEMIGLCAQHNIDFYAIEERLADDPSIEERKNLIGPLIEFCDGFMQFDFDPRDENEIIESVIIFNPKQHTYINEIIK